MGLRTFRNITDHAINVDGVVRAPNAPFTIDTSRCADVLLVGKFKNRKATITGFSSDENNQPVAQTDKDAQKIFKPRIAKLMPAKTDARHRGKLGNDK